MAQVRARKSISVTNEVRVELYYQAQYNQCVTIIDLRALTDQRPDVVQRMKNITAAGNLRQSLLVPGAEPRGEIGDGGLRSEAPVDQFQQPDAPGIGVAMLFRTQQEAEGGFGIDPHQDGIARLEDLIEEADEDGGEVVLLVDAPGMSNGAVHDVVHGPQGDPIIEEVAQQFDHAAGRTMADEH